MTLIKDFKSSREDLEALLGRVGGRIMVEASSTIKCINLLLKNYTEICICSRNPFSCLLLRVFRTRSQTATHRKSTFSDFNNNYKSLWLLVHKYILFYFSRLRAFASRGEKNAFQPKKHANRNLVYIKRHNVKHLEAIVSGAVEGCTEHKFMDAMPYLHTTRKYAEGSR